MHVFYNFLVDLWRGFGRIIMKDENLLFLL